MHDIVYYEEARLSTKDRYQNVDDLVKMAFGNNSIHFIL